MNAIKDALQLREDMVEENVQLRNHIAKRMTNQLHSRTLKIVTLAFSSGMAVLALALVIGPSFSPATTGVFAPQIANAAEIIKRADQVIADLFAQGKIVRMDLAQTYYDSGEITSQNTITVESDGIDSHIAIWESPSLPPDAAMTLTFIGDENNVLPSVVTFHEDASEDSTVQTLSADTDWEAIISWEGVASRLMTDTGSIDETTLTRSVDCDNCGTMLATVDGSELIGNEDAYKIVLHHPEGSEDTNTYVSWIGKENGQLLQREIYNERGERTITQRFAFTVLDTFTEDNAFQE